MLKNIGLPLIALAVLLVLLSPAPAKAAVHFGVFVGPPAPVYPAPYPYYNPYSPYAYSYPYNYNPYYGYNGGLYVSPYSSWGWGHRDRDDRRYYDHGRYEHGFRDSRGYGHHEGHGRR